MKRIILILFLVPFLFQCGSVFDVLETNKRKERLRNGREARLKKNKQELQEKAIKKTGLELVTEPVVIGSIKEDIAEDEKYLEEKYLGDRYQEAEVEINIPGVDIEEMEQVTVEEDIYKIFDRAENLFQDSQLIEALHFYKLFLANNKDSDIADDAIYRIGEIYFYLKNYELSSEHFTNLLKKFPDSDFYREAEYFSALCYFFLGDHVAAIKIFEKIIPERIDEKKLAEIHYFKGKSHYKIRQFIDAVDQMNQAVEISEDDQLIEFAQNTIKAIIENEMDQDALEEILDSFSGKSSSGYALYKLAQQYSKEKDYQSAKDNLEELISEYPDHEYQEKAESWLNGLNVLIDSHELKIGLVLPLSGAASGAGESVLKGIRLALGSFADEDKDKEIRLIIKDSAGDPQIAVNIVREFAAIDNVIAIVGPVFSKSALAVSPVSKELKIPVITPTASADGIVELSEYMFRNCVTNKLQGKAVAEYAVNELALKRFAVLYPDNVYGTSLKNIFKENIRSLGAEIVAEQLYNPSANDFGKEIKSIGGMNDEEIKFNVIKNYNKKVEGRFINDLETGLSKTVIDESIDPNENRDYIQSALRLNYDAIFIPGYFEKVGLIAPELAFYNISGVKLLGANGWNSPELVKIGGKYINDGVFVDGFFSDSTDTVVKEFVDNFQQVFQKKADILSAQSYDSMKILGEAINSGYITREGIRTYLSNEVVEYQGVSGITTILPSGDVDKKLYKLTVRKGKIEQIH